ncbi:MAG: RNA 2',3'-cyclic phosphodiesterase [Oscillospiraceae bacterium]|nr:RNA 2',3'-cyclic phosphodiesterase [Oscillospiraceae bacterium]
MEKTVTRLQDAFHAHGVGGAYVPTENLHITLAFIGEYSDPDSVLEVIEGLSFSAFDLSMDRLGCFDDLWWTGFSDSSPLEKLARELRHALAKAGIPYDKTKFKPHVTFLRRAKMIEGRQLAVNFKAAGMKVERISLMRSTHGKNGMIYTELGTVYAR